MNEPSGALSQGTSSVTGKGVFDAPVLWAGDGLRLSTSCRTRSPEVGAWKGGGFWDVDLMANAEAHWTMAGSARGVPQRYSLLDTAE